MEFSSGYWHYFHYSDSRGYLIFCCHCVAMKSYCINNIIAWLCDELKGNFYYTLEIYSCIKATNVSLIFLFKSLMFLYLDTSILLTILSCNLSGMSDDTASLYLEMI